MNRCTVLIITVFVSLSFIAGSYASSGTRLSYTAYFVDNPIIIDGYLDDHSWNNLPLATGFKPLSKPGIFTEKQTSFKIGWNEKVLYMGVICDEPDIEKISGDSLWLDGLEIFIAHAFPGYQQLAINTNGNFAWVGYNCKTEAAVSKGNKRWTAEIAIPFTEFGGIPETGTVWRFNIARNISVFDSGGDKHSTWSNLIANFHDVNNFASLEFSSEKLNPKKVSELQQQNIKELYQPFFNRVSYLLKKVEQDISLVKREYGNRKELKNDIVEMQKETTSFKKRYKQIQRSRDFVSLGKLESELEAFSTQLYEWMLCSLVGI